MLVMTPAALHQAHVASDKEDQRLHKKTNQAVHVFNMSMLTTLHAEYLALMLVIA